MQQIIDKIQKLHAMEYSAREIGSIKEAEAFATKVQQLLRRHKLDITEIQNINRTDDVPNILTETFSWSAVEGLTDQQRKTWWHGTLASTVAEYLTCYVYYSNRTPHNSDLCIVGPRDNLVVFRYMLVNITAFMLSDLETNYRKAYYTHKKDGNTRAMKGWRASYIAAFIDTISNRLQCERARMDQRDVNTRAMVQIDKEEAALRAHKDKSRLGKCVFTTSQGFNVHGHASGRSAGQRASLATNTSNH